jgi:Family of unknown function (DUF6286)
VPRIVNRVLAAAVALTVAAGGLLVAAEIALAGLGRGPWIIPYDDWYARARGTAWEAAGARWLSAALAAAGLALLLLQVWRAAPRSLPLPEGRSRAALSRRSVEQALARAAGGVAGVSAATAQVKRRRAHLVVTGGPGTEDVRSRVEGAAGARLQCFGLVPSPKLAVDVKRRNGR